MSEGQNSRPATRGSWKPGTSGNPGGRPRAHREYLRQLIGERGERAYDALVGIAEGEIKIDVERRDDFGGVFVEKRAASMKERIECWIFLAEQLNGRSSSSLEVSGQIDHTHTAGERDYSQLTEAELTALEGTLRKTVRSGDVVDVEPVAVPQLPAGEPT